MFAYPLSGRICDAKFEIVRLHLGVVVLELLLTAHVYGVITYSAIPPIDSDVVWQATAADRPQPHRILARPEDYEGLVDGYG